MSSSKNNLLIFQTQINQLTTEINSLKQTNSNLLLQISGLQSFEQENNNMKIEIRNMDIHIQELISILEQRDRTIHDMEIHIQELKNNGSAQL